MDVKTTVKSDIEIAQQSHINPIKEAAEKMASFGVLKGYSNV